VKLSGKELQNYLKAVKPSCSNFLFFGPDGGQVRELAKTFSEKFVSDPSDPFSVTRLTGAEIKSDGAVLYDAAFSMALTGGDCVVVVSEGTDVITSALEDVFSSTSPSWPIIVEAGELSPRSKLRKAFEGRKDAAAFGCYSEDGRNLERVVAGICQEFGLTISPDALAFLAGNLGGDRMVVRREVEKLCLYALEGSEGSGRIEFESAERCIGDSRESSIDAIVDAVGEGRQKTVGEILDKAFSEGVSAIAVIRAVQRHFQRLQLVNDLLSRGMTQDRAMGQLRPPVFFKRKDSFLRQASGWNGQRLTWALGIITQCEIDCKSTGMPAELLCNRALMRIAFAA